MLFAVFDFFLDFFHRLRLRPSLFQFFDLHQRRRGEQQILPFSIAGPCQAFLNQNMALLIEFQHRADGVG
ncbi:hypothetical protein AFM18_24710 [Achromobacter spanius]|uniref:Transposase n=1 Tax=Achromobacter spanius TaxID=217203 RepID=A0AAW3HX05_9BURK|nr:hypothetical protein AFM18_24710 [Achromobacter spanius]